MADDSGPAANKCHLGADRNRDVDFVDDIYIQGDEKSQPKRLQIEQEK